jgi:hypothetical protein
MRGKRTVRNPPANGASRNIESFGYRVDGVVPGETTHSLTVTTGSGGGGHNTRNISALAAAAACSRSRPRFAAASVETKTFTPTFMKPRGDAGWPHLVEFRAADSMRLAELSSRSPEVFNFI